MATSRDEDLIYWGGAVLVGVVAFAGGWAYAIGTYGLFLGLGLGWIPALFVGLIVGLLWPLVLAGAFLLFMIAQSQ